MKAQGVAVGLMDGFIMGPDRFFAWMELKAGRNTTSDAQDGWAEHVSRCGFHWWLIRSVVELHDHLAAAGAPVTGYHRALAEGHDRALGEDAAPRKVSQRAGMKRKPSAKAKAFNNLFHGVGG